MAEYAPRRLIDFLRASHYYNLEAVGILSIARGFVVDFSVGVCHLHRA